MTIPQYDYIWRTQRRFAEVLSDEDNGIEVELAAIAAADDTLDDLTLTPPEQYYPVDNEREAAELRENKLCYACLYPTGDDVVTHHTGDLESRTDEHLWRLVLAIADTQEAGNATFVESWGDMPADVRERRRLSVVLGAASQVIARHARNGVDIVQAVPLGRPDHGVMPTNDGIVRWARQTYQIISYVEIPQHGSTAT